MDNGKKSFRPNQNRSGNGRRNYKSYGFVALLILFGLIIYAAYGQSSNIKNIPLTQAIAENNKGQYSKLELDGNQLTITKRGQNQPTLRTFTESGIQLKDQGFDLSKTTF